MLNLYPVNDLRLCLFVTFLLSHYICIIKSIIYKYMGDIRLKQQTDSSKKNKLDSKQLNPSKKFVLSDVSKEELKKRRIPVYSYLL